jgi:rod shape-determining protein MreD
MRIQARRKNRRLLLKIDMSSDYMLNMSEHSDRNIEVHKFYNGAIFAVCVLALVFQAFLHKYGRWSELIDLPLLVTIYFGFSRRNPISGMFLGGVIGIAQDALSHDNPIGMYGIAKTIVGYTASSIGGRIDTEHPVSRFGLIFVFFHFHQAILVITQRALLNHSARFFSWQQLVDSLVTAAFGVLLFALLDRLRRSS